LARADRGWESSCAPLGTLVGCDSLGGWRAQPSNQRYSWRPGETC